jgi:ribose 5-phosphate isomerase RpiB
MKLFIGADHNGFDMKATLSEYLRRGGYEVVDEGDAEKHPDDDFFQFAASVVHANHPHLLAHLVVVRLPRVPRLLGL